jgi:eukaryotic-like serine/threonine-protein kinase
VTARAGPRVILGTAAYMSPEQAKGRVADKRSDVWAFGCVVYEMVTGRRAFAGDDVTEVLANVLKTEPDWTATTGLMPPRLRRLLAHTLDRNAGTRIAHASILGLNSTKFCAI